MFLKESVTSSFLEESRNEWKTVVKSQKCLTLWLVVNYGAGCKDEDLRKSLKRIIFRKMMSQVIKVTEDTDLAISVIQ